mgnify:CR=1 FL=1
MAKPQCTQTQPKFVWRFFLPRLTRLKFVIAHSEAEARKQLRNPAYVFSARFLITDGVYQLQAHMRCSDGSSKDTTLPEMFTSRELAENIARENSFEFSHPCRPGRPARSGKVTLEVVEVRHV